MERKRFVDIAPDIAELAEVAIAARAFVAAIED